MPVYTLQFCQPSGWTLTAQKLQSTFFVSVLTDIDADRHYCACLTFYEDVMVAPPRVDEEEEEEAATATKESSGNSPASSPPSTIALVQCAKMYAPKSLVLVSRLDYFETFRVCGMNDLKCKLIFT